MVTITPTRRPVWPRIKARIAASHIRFLIGTHERDVQARIAQLDTLPRELDAILNHIAELRVQLALAEKDA